jgi:creatinine amidohydrolase/Fe(II)-dependent formamide hydrolase-like protein
VPEGAIDPPSGHMKYPGTLSVTEATYERLLTDLCASLRMHGFRHIVLLGDSLGNQAGMQAVARRLATQWATTPVRVHFVPEYYDYDEVTRWLEEQAIHMQPENVHDDFITTAQLLAVDPTTVRLQQRLAEGPFCVSGLELSPEQTAAWGKRIIAFRAEQTVRAIQKATRAEAGRGKHTRE